MGVPIAGHNAWVNGPFPDIRILNFMAKLLDDDEIAVADNGYKLKKCLSKNGLEGSFKRIYKRMRRIMKQLSGSLDCLVYCVVYLDTNLVNTCFFFTQLPRGLHVN